MGSFWEITFVICKKGIKRKIMQISISNSLVGMQKGLCDYEQRSRPISIHVDIHWKYAKIVLTHWSAPFCEKWMLASNEQVIFLWLDWNTFAKTHFIDDKMPINVFLLLLYLNDCLMDSFTEWYVNLDFIHKSINRIRCKQPFSLNAIQL